MDFRTKSALENRIAKLKSHGDVNNNLVRKAERQLRKLEKKEKP